MTAISAGSQAGSPVARPLTTALSVDQLSVRLGGRTIVDEVSFELRAGEWLGLIGPNGAGKSTLLGALAGTRSHSGVVSGRAGETPARSDIALVPQVPTLPVGMTVAEYVLLGRTAHLGWLATETRRDRDIVRATLDRLDLADFAARQVAELSGGEGQRVVVARALVQQAPVLLLDEPTSALDLGHQATVLDLVDQLRREDGLSVIAAMHDLGTAARHADRVLLLNAGSVVAVAEPSAVFDESLLSQVYGAPVRVREVDGELVVLPGARPRPHPPTDADRSRHA